VVKFLPFIQFASNHSWHSSINAFPARLSFGREMRTSIELLLPRPELVTIPDGQYSEHLESIIQSVWQHARKYLEMAKETQKLYYDMDVVPSIISPGDRVFKHSPAGKPGLATKLLRHWIGPYEVLEVSPTNALGESTQTGFPEVFSGPKTWAAETIR